MNIETEFEMRPEVQAVYDKYVRDHHGEVSVPELVETAYNAGARAMSEEMVQFSQLPYYARKNAEQAQRLADLIERVAGEQA